MITFEWSDWRNSWFWWIQSVYISPEFRGKGVYRQLYEFVVNKAQAQGDVCGFRLYVERENTRAQKVYEKLGMETSHYLMFEATRLKWRRGFVAKASAQIWKIKIKSEIFDMRLVEENVYPSIWMH